MPKINPIQENANLIKKARSATYWLFGSSVAIQLISWAITVFVARILSPDDYGLFGMAALLTSFLVMFNELGLGPAVIQKKDLTQEQLSSCFWVIIGLNLFLYLLAFILAPLVASFFHEPRLTPIIRVAAMNIILGGCYKLPYSLLTKELMFNKRSVVDFISKFLGSIFTFFLATLGYGVWSLVFGLLISDFTKLILAFIFTKWLPKKIFSFNSIKSMIYFGYNITAGKVLWYFYSNSDYLIAAKFLGKTLLGYYSLAFQLASLPIEKIISLIGQIIFPFFSKIQDEEEILRNYFLKAVRFTAFIVFPIFIGMFLVADSAIVLILSEKWKLTILPFKILCFIGTLRAINSFNSHLTYATGKPTVYFSNMIIFSLVMPIGFFIGSKYGLKGLSYVWLFLYPLVFLITTKRSISIINLKFLEYCKNLIPPTIATLFMGSLVSMSKIMLLNYPNTFSQLIFHCSIGIISYFAFIYFFLKKDLLEMTYFILKEKRHN